MVAFGHAFDALKDWLAFVVVYTALVLAFYYVIFKD
jgi:hypothetical protein